jgi:phosphoribosyl 1,2-cyclic phosphodiesterase
MKVTVLASGSKGNCTYIEGESGALLIDAGLSAKEITRRLQRAGGDPGLIHAVLVTHEHGDHIRGVDVLARRLDVPVIATSGTLGEFYYARRNSSAPVKTEACRCDDPFHIGDFRVVAFATCHDAREPCGFCIREDGAMLGCCTDTGMVTPHMAGYLHQCDALVLESNHCPHMLEHGPYPAFLKRRIRDTKRGHLSNEASAACLNRLADQVSSVMLAHLSEVNNTPGKALACARDALGLYNGNITVRVAPQHEISETIVV